MKRQNLIVGGESVFPPNIIFHKHQGVFSNYGADIPGYYRYYTFGGYYSFKAILQNIRFTKENYVLLPSYLCPSMIWPFQEAGIKYDFYKIKEGLLPDLEDISTKSGKGLKLILFVDYFGYSYKGYLKDAITNLKENNVLILQDAVQAWLNSEDQVYGDYCINSVRKYSPFEASVILSKHKLQFKSSILPMIKYLAHKRVGQLIRYYHVNYNKFTPRSFLRHIEASNAYYRQDTIVGLPRLNKYLLDKIDFDLLGTTRITMFQKVANCLDKRSLVGLELGSAVPLVLPLTLENRNQKKKLLHERDIHCPIHWLLSEEIDKKEHEYSWYLQNHELSIPVNISTKHSKKYCAILKEIL
ncbi:MAG: hypothetical protein LHW44_01490 [Candidatus Cloacimonetes bacterium]|nr:hypothetical protein [Candidatus Cloacimonadota bacterium]